jgi:hypothetical protein
MARVHVLNTVGGRTRVIFHIDVPSGNNTAGTAWSTVLVNSGLGGSTVLTDGTGASGTVAAPEKTALAAGTVFEVEDRIAVPTGMTTAQANAFFDALHAAKTTEVQAEIPRLLGVFGFTRT